MEERGISRAHVLEIIRTAPPFEYRHRRQKQLGYWERETGIMVAVGNAIITTVLIDVDERYLKELKERT